MLNRPSELRVFGKAETPNDSSLPPRRRKARAPQRQEWTHTVAHQKFRRNPRDLQNEKRTPPQSRRGGGPLDDQGLGFKARLAFVLLMLALPLRLRFVIGVLRFLFPLFRLAFYPF